MAKHCLFIFSFIFLLAMASSCEEDTLDNLATDVIGSEFVVATETLYLEIEEQTEAKRIYYNYKDYDKDTLMLGEYFDDYYGTVKAEALMEVAFPGATIPLTKPAKDKEGKEDIGHWENPTYQGLTLVLNTANLNGTAKSPLQVDIYRLKKNLDAEGKYYTDIDPLELEYYSKNDILATAWVTGKDSLSYIKLPYELGEAFFNQPASTFTNAEEFREFFKGLYLTTSESSDLMLMFRLKYRSYLRLDYQYEKLVLNDNTAEQDDVTVMRDSIVFKALSSSPKAQIIKNSVNPARKTDPDFNYVSSPAGLQPVINMDLPRINQKLGENNFNLNKAVLTLKVEENEDSSLPTPLHLLLIQEDALENFFEDRKLPDDKSSFVGVRTTDNEYQFDIARYIQQKRNDNEMDKTDKMVVVPVSALFNNGQTVYCREKIGLSALRFRSEDGAQIRFIYNRLASIE